MKVLRDLVEPKWETIPVTESLHRVTKSAVYAKYCSPLFNSAAMDGIAVISEHTKGASEVTPVELIRGRDFQIVDTGDPVHPPYDAVIMAEDLMETGDEDRVRIVEAAAPWQHVRQIGEDICAGEMILPSRTEIGPSALGAMLAAGVLECEVCRRPVVGIIPTGDELVPPCEAQIGRASCRERV